MPPSPRPQPYPITNNGSSNFRPAGRCSASTSHDRAGDIGLDLVEHLHRLDDRERLAGLDRLADFHERAASPDSADA